MISLEQFRKSAQLMRRGRRVFDSCATPEQRLVAQQYWISILNWHKDNNIPIFRKELQSFFKEFYDSEFIDPGLETLVSEGISPNVEIV